MTEYEQNILNRIEQLYIEGMISNSFLVQNIKLSGDFLNLKTKSAYSASKGISYQGVKPTKTRMIEELF